MTEHLLEPINEEPPVLVFIQRIKDGQLDPKTLNKELRQQCVEVFLYEGYGISAMAQILQRSDKTIQRDVAEIRERNAISPDIGLAKKMVGEMVSHARNHHAYLMRLARSPGASVSEKGQCEYLAATVLFQQITKLQSLGYLPLQPQSVVGDIFHHHEDASQKDAAGYRAMIDEIETSAREAGSVPPEIAKEIKQLKLQVDKVEIDEKVNELTKINKSEKEQGEIQ